MATPRYYAEILEQLTKKMEQAIDNLSNEIFDQQDDLAKKFERLSEAYNTLLARIIHMEAADVKGAITKIDSHLQKLIELRTNYKHIEKTVTDMEKDLKLVTKRHDRLSTILWVVSVIGAALFVNLVAPIATAWIAKHLGLQL